MANSTQFTTILLTGYLDVGQTKYIYFAILMLMFIVVIIANTILISLVFIERSLHEPMYIFVCCLSVSEIYGSAAIFPLLLTQIVSTFHEVTIVNCYVQMFVLYTYGSLEFGTLVIMSYDRYTAICYPFQYINIMTRQRVCTLIAVVWVMSFVKYSINIYLSLRLVLCGNVIDKVYCDNFLLIKLACSDINVNNIYGIIGTIVTIVLPLFLILFSYIKIFIVCLKSTIETQKTLRTCVPHLLSLVNFSLCSLFEILSSRFNDVYMPRVLRVFISVYFLMSSPLFNPIIYGIRLSKIKNAFRKRFLPRRNV